MKRIALGLAMLGSFALMAAQANAAALGECVKSYAFQVHGTEPELSNDSALHYIVGIGQIAFGAAGTSGPTGCTVTHLELEYNDNAVLTLNAGPATCDTGNSLLGTGIPCFDGADHQNVGGTLTPSPFGNGGQRLTIDPSFTWVNGGPGAADLPLAFTLQGNTGSSVIIGAVVPDNGPNPTSAPPGSPSIVITMQKQSTTAILPVNGGGNGYGTTPYVGLSMSLFEGYGAPHADPFNLPGISGSFGSTVSALQIFTNGQAGGSTSFSSNDNVGNTTGVTENDCDTQLSQESNFADGTSNNVAAIVHGSATCGDAFAGAAFTIDTVQWGTTDTDDYAIVSGLADTADTGGEYIPSGDIATAIGLASSPAGKLAVTLAPATETDTGPFPQTKGGILKLTNTSPAGCDTAEALVSQSGPHSVCTVSLTASTTLAEGDLVSTDTVNCTCTQPSTSATCTGAGAPYACCTGAHTGTCALETDTYNVNTTSSDCPVASGNTILFTCKN